MLELKTNCENCNTELPYDSKEAMICSFECTYCVNCVENILQNTCPNCGGELQRRPARPSHLIRNYPQTDNSK